MFTEFMTMTVGRTEKWLILFWRRRIINHSLFICLPKWRWLGRTEKWFLLQTFRRVFVLISIAQVYFRNKNLLMHTYLYAQKGSCRLEEILTSNSPWLFPVFMFEWTIICLSFVFGEILLWWMIMNFFFETNNGCVDITGSNIFKHTFFHTFQ